MKSYWKMFREFNRNVWLFLFYWSMIAFGYFGIVGVLMNLYLLRLGYETEFIGLVLGSGQLVWAAFALPAGMIGSRIGAKRAMVIGMGLLVAGMAAMLAVEWLPEDVRPVGLMLTWMMSWVGAALGNVNSAPYIMAVTDDRTRGFAFSAQQTVMAAAGFAGSMAAGILPGMFAQQMNLTLDDPAPYRLALLLAPLAYLAAFYAISRAASAAAPVQQAQDQAVEKAPVALFVFLGLIIGFQSFSEGTVRAFFNVYLDTRLAVPTELIGGIMGLSQLLLILISLVIPAVLARWGSKGSLSLGALGLAAFLLVLAWAPGAFGASLGYVGITAMLTVTATARQIFGQEAVTPRWRTMSSAISIIGLALGWASAAWLGGSLVKTIGFQGLFLLGSLSALLSVALLVVYGSRARAPQEAKEDRAVIAITGEPEEAC